MKKENKKRKKVEEYLRLLPEIFFYLRRTLPEIFFFHVSLIRLQLLFLFSLTVTGLHLDLSPFHPIDSHEFS